MDEIYLDNAAATPLHPEVLKIYMAAEQKFWGNCSNTTHSYGRASKQALETARQRVGDLLGLSPKGIIFTSGATEANNLALRGISCLQKQDCALIVSSIEHACIEESTKFILNRGIKVLKIKTLPNGLIDVDHLESLARHSNASLISVMLVNNETGVVQPLKKISDIATRYNMLLHTDAVQAVGKIPLNVLKYVDMASFSGHKFNAPKGVGCLWIRPDLKVSPLLVGGGQEFGIRSGTTAVPLIVAFARALEIAVKDTSWINPISKAMKHMEDQLKKIPKVIINGSDAPRNGVISNISFPYEKLVIRNLRGVAASTASACGCASATPSKVLLSMGLPASYARNTLRISAGRFTKPNDILLATQRIISAVKTL